MTGTAITILIIARADPAAYFRPETLENPGPARSDYPHYQKHHQDQDKVSKDVKAVKDEFHSLLGDKTMEGTIQGIEAPRKS